MSEKHTLFRHMWVLTWLVSLAFWHVCLYRQTFGSSHSSTMARSLILKTSLNEGLPGPEHFEIQKSAWPTLGDGVIVMLLTVSADPYMRYRIRSDGDYKPGEPMLGLVAGKIIDSNMPEWKVGDLFGAELPYTDVQAVPASKAKAFRRLTGLISEDQISLGVGALGMPGSTAYGGLIDILKPQKGETLWVSGAAGAVGSMVGMMAKHVFGCTVVGSAGGPAKCKLVKEQFGFDHCVDYKACESAKDLAKALRRAAPGGIDMYFENVGGMHFEAAMQCLRPKGRVAICGVISDYNKAKMSPNKIYISNMIYTEQTIQGFHCLPWLLGEKGHFLDDMAGWVREGKVQVRETVFNGLDSFGSAFRALFEGTNTGKVVVRVFPATSKLWLNDTGDLLWKIVAKHLENLSSLECFFWSWMSLSLFGSPHLSPPVKSSHSHPVQKLADAELANLMRKYTAQLLDCCDLTWLDPFRDLMISSKVKFTRFEETKELLMGTMSPKQGAASWEKHYTHIVLMCKSIQQYLHQLEEDMWSGIVNTHFKHKHNVTIKPQISSCRIKSKLSMSQKWACSGGHLQSSQEATWQMLVKRVVNGASSEDWVFRIQDIGSHSSYFTRSRPTSEEGLSTN